MEDQFLSNEYIKKKIKTGAGAAIGALAHPSARSEEVGKEYSLGIRNKRLADEQSAEIKEGNRLAAMPVKKPKPYTNPDGSPFTREQISKALGR